MYKENIVFCATHLIPLVKCFEKSNRDVLEIGTGLYSTPLLDWLCEMYSRHLVSLDTDKKWSKLNIEKYQKPSHEVIYTPDLDKIDITDRHWGLVLIDHSPSPRRKIDILRLKNNADYIVIHDTQPSKDWKFRFSKVYPEFKYVYHYNKINPHTTIVSNFKNLDFLQ
jgi:hypothetical protein